MLKISKLTDYGLLAAVFLARKHGAVANAREISDFYSLPLPAVSKVLKTLHEGKIITSQRGVGGGYVFNGEASSITLGRLLEVLEGRWDLVECETTDDHGHAVCAIRTCCPSRTFMGGINQAIKFAFDQVTLADLVRGTTAANITQALQPALASMTRSQDVQ
jgi:Rrf2 family protein